MAKFNPYKVLDVEPDADAATIKSARRRRSKETHPDKEGGDQEEFQKVQRAWLVLSNPERRRKYDETGDADDSVFHDPAAGAAGVLTSLLMQLMDSEGDIFQHDLVAVMRKHLKVGVAKLESILEAQRRLTERNKKMRGRFKVKKGPNRIESILAWHAGEIRRAIIKAEGELDIVRLAIEMLEDYEFTKDATPEQTFNMGRVRVTTAWTT